MLKILMLLALPLTANAAGPWNRFFQDAKFPTQAIFDHDTWVNPVLGGTGTLKSAAALPTSAATTVTISTNPDMPRNVTLTPGGSGVNSPNGTAIVSGTNITGAAITENFTMTGGSLSTVTGAKAFKTVTSVAVPATGGAGSQLNVGVGTKLGLRRCLDDAGKYVFAEFGGVYEATRGTQAADATHLELNTFAPNSSPDGAHNVDLFYVENFRCF